MFKDLKLQNHQRFVYSEKLHLLAIKIVLFGFSPEIKLFQHLFNSYKKNYNFNVVAI